MTDLFNKNAKIINLGSICKAPFFITKDKINHFAPRQSNSFLFFLSGKIDFIYDEVTLNVKENSLVFLPQNMAYKTRPIENGEYIILNFFTDAYFVKKPFSFTPENSEDFIRLINKAIKAEKYKNQGYFYQVLASIYSLCALCEEQFVTKTVPAHLNKLKPCIDLMKSDPYVTVNELAKSINVSTKYFTRLFIEAFNTPPKQYMINLQLNKAAELLKENKSVTDAALACGFCDVYYFSKLFKKHMGITPTEYKGYFL